MPRILTFPASNVAGPRLNDGSGAAKLAGGRYCRQAIRASDSHCGPKYNFRRKDLPIGAMCRLDIRPMRLNPSGKIDFST
jgi:hypothetical protein